MGDWVSRAGFLDPPTISLLAESISMHFIEISSDSVPRIFGNTILLKHCTGYEEAEARKATMKSTNGKVGISNFIILMLQRVAWGFWVLGRSE